MKLKKMNKHSQGILSKFKSSSAEMMAHGNWLIRSSLKNYQNYNFWLPRVLSSYPYRKIRVSRNRYRSKGKNVKQPRKSNGINICRKLHTTLDKQKVLIDTETGFLFCPRCRHVVLQVKLDSCCSKCGYSFCSKCNDWEGRIDFCPPLILA